MKFLLWCILLVLCWPLAVLALIAYPLIWIFLIPFRLVGIAVDGVLGLVRAVVDAAGADRHRTAALLGAKLVLASAPASVPLE